uniref:UBR-type domain-containing protein n=1 Tax=Angiostrongylus cantonensis TaxID=6313 RepID=A0A0K0DDW3_ANGCA
MADPNDDLLNEVESNKKEDVQQSISESSKLDGNKEESSGKDLSNENEEDTEDFVTIQEILDNEEYSRECARVLYGAQDPAVCTYPEVNGAGICLGCSVHCHDGHNIIELYTKRRFRCDCGNSKFERKCTLFEEKSSSNAGNTYNQNFAGLFCVCKKPYPSEIEETMHQCVVCEDWFHLTHLDEKCAQRAEQLEQSGRSDYMLLCKVCSSRLPFLWYVSVSEANNSVVCLSTVEDVKEGPFLLPCGFRERLCRCQNCLDLYARSGCEFLIDAEDDVDTFVKENIEKTKDVKEPDDNALVNDLVQKAGMDVAIGFLRGFNDLKRGLHDFIREKVEEGVDVITSEHVTSFFDKLKRSRFERDSGEDV